MQKRLAGSSSWSAEGREKYAAMGSERSKPLQNFVLPCLKWENQRYLRCVKLGDENCDEFFGSDANGFLLSPMLKLNIAENSGMEIGTGKATENRRTAKTVRMTKRKIFEDDAFVDAENEKDDGIEALREKLIFHLKTAARKMKDAILPEEGAGEVEEAAKEQEPQQVTQRPSVIAVAAKMEDNEERPWNLRTWRADSNLPISGGIGIPIGQGVKMESEKPNCSPSRTAAMKSPKLGACPSTEKIERQKLSLTLSKKEIEEEG